MIRIFQTISILAVLVLFWWMGTQNVVPGGVFGAAYDFDDESPFVTPLSPGDRVRPIVIEDGDAFQAVIDDPVYFRVRAPRSFQRAHLLVHFQNPSGHPFQIGGLMSWERFQFDLQNVEVVEERGGWLVGEASFDLTYFYAPDGRTYTFALSLPKIAETGQQVLISKIEVNLRRDPQTISQMIKEYLY